MDGRFAWFCPLILCWVSLSSAQPKPPAPELTRALDLLPSDAPIGVAIDNIARLTERGDAYFEKAGVERRFRLAEAYQWLIRILGLRGLDEQGSAALVLMNQRGGEFNFEQLVLAVPIADLDRAAASLGVRVANLMPGEVIPVAEGRMVRHAALQGEHLVLGLKPEPVAGYLASKRLRELPAAADQSRFGPSDVLVYARPRQAELGPSWFTLPPAQAAELPQEERELLLELAVVEKELKHVVWSLRFDEALQMRFQIQFEGAKSRELFTRLRGAGPPADLRGLPRGNLLAAVSAVGSGETSALLSQALLRQAPVRSLAESSPLLSLTHRRIFLDLGSEIWSRLQGGAAGWYENDPGAKAGKFAAMTVVETANPKTFLKELTGLASFVNASSLGAGGAAPTAEEIERLVKQLADDSYRVRQAASTRLALIGPPALEKLAQAERGADPEAKYRARQLREQIAVAEKELKADLLNRVPLAGVKPQFVYRPRAETRNGQSVDWIEILLTEADQRQGYFLRDLLGDDWNKIRLTTVGKRMVFLFGSRGDLFDQAVKDLASDRDSWRDVQEVQRFRERVGGELTAEMHLQLARLKMLVQGDEKTGVPPSETAAKTSLGLRIAPQTLGIDLYLPASEGSTVLRAWGW